MTIGFNNQTGVAPKRISILGATGSVGQSTIDILRRQPDQFTLEAVIGKSNIAQLATDAKALNAAIAVTADEARYDELKQALAGSGIEAAAGDAAVIEAASRPVDMTMAAIVGIDGLRPTLAAMKAGCNIGLANKECLVSAGSLFMQTAKDHNVDVLPVDSEHSAIFQCFEKQNFAAISKITLTASGGPFRQSSVEDLKAVTPAMALRHPNWSMGAKITIDSATMMNKGLELIEAFHLFPVGLERIDVVVHPQSIIHSCVSYCDGSMLAQLGLPDMRTPIALALAWPERMVSHVEDLDLAKIATLNFETLDNERFPAVNLCRSALQRGGTATTILNAANEIAVASFLEEKLSFTGISALVADVLERAEAQSMIVLEPGIEDVWAADAFARKMAQELST